jgi:uncharacterized protein (TIGR00304 family)
LQEFYPSVWLPVNFEFLWDVGFVLVVVGFAIAAVAMFWIVLSGSRTKNREGEKEGGERRVRGGGVIIIGPVPIILGTDKQSVKVLLVLTIVLVALLLVFTVFSQGLFG